MENVKKMGLFSMILLGINSIIGSGIFLLPGNVYTEVGSKSIFVYGLATILVLSITLCFAEAGGMFSKNGGSYVYAKEAFGDFVGFEVGIMSWVIRIISWSTLAVGFATALGLFWPEAATTYKNLVASALVIFLGVNSLFGMNNTKVISNVATVGKLVPLILFVAIGVFFIKPENISQQTASVGMSGIASGIILVFYAFTGFESFVVATGEMENPKKNLPIALLSTLAIVAVMYIAIQLICVGVLGSDLAGNKTPIADASSALLGSFSKTFIGVATLISIFGINIASSIVTPRCGSALAEDGLVPAIIGKTNKNGAPYIAIIISIVLCIPLVLSGSFEQLAVMSVVARFAQYIPTCLSIVVLRKRNDLSSGFRVPFGPVIPAIAVLGSLWLVQQAFIQDIGKPILENRVIFGLGAMVLAIPLYFIMNKKELKVSQETDC